MLNFVLGVCLLKDGSVWRTNKFMDASQSLTASSADMRIWERRLLYCVPVRHLGLLPLAIDFEVAAIE